MDMVASVEEFPLAGQTVLGRSLRVYPGGKGANQCVAAARLGAQTAMIGMVGSDGNGKTFLELFQEEGIDCANVFVTEKEPTAIAQIQINAAAENKIVVIPSANFVFGEREWRQCEKAIKESAVVIMQMELNPGITEEIIRTCARLSVPVVLNPAPARNISGEVLGLATYVTPNETELELLTGMPTDTEENIYKAAGKLLSFGVRAVVATLGKRGALVADAHGKRIIPGYTVKVVDTVAAGDSFNGALAKCITEGKSLDEAVRYANAVGALTVSKQGAIPSLPTAAEVEAFIKARA
jgi:ribokinase